MTVDIFNEQNWVWKNVRENYYNIAHFGVEFKLLYYVSRFSSRAMTKVSNEVITISIVIYHMFSIHLFICFYSLLVIFLICSVGNVIKLNLPLAPSFGCLLVSRIQHLRCKPFMVGNTSKCALSLSKWFAFNILNTLQNTQTHINNDETDQSFLFLFQRR